MGGFKADVTQCRGVGPTTATLLQQLGIFTVEDLLYHVPRYHLDRRAVTKLGSISQPQTAVIEGKVLSIRTSRPSRRFRITQCRVRDDTGTIRAIWFNQPYIERTLPAGTTVILSGAVSDRHGLQLENPDVEVVSDDEKDFLHTLRLVPVYPLTKGISQKRMRRLLRAAVDEFAGLAPENISRRILRNERLPSRKDALRDIHFPAVHEQYDVARRRMAFEEFLALQLAIQSATGAGARTGIAHNAAPRLTEQLHSTLPFTLTTSQQRAIDTIFREMESPEQMNVLLQGDVGSGKTIVAIAAMLKAIENGRQAILMAPTEILAEQHAMNMRACVHTLIGNTEIEIALLTGGRPAIEKTHALEVLAAREPALIVGTHALIQKSVAMPNIGLVVIDEQHRFGVNQRASFRDKGIDADLIVMTATPIPRTLALALYGNFETITIDELPPGRHAVETRHVLESDREKIDRLVRKEIKSSRQVFVVCPEIGEGAGSDDRATAGAKRVHARYSKTFPDSCVGLLHGRMSAEERERVLLQFRDNQINILVATTIVEVGVDVPNATVIIVEDADRFGLAQLHQLRGRVGRAQHKSYCFLVGEPTTVEANERIKIMTSTNDGFKIAEQDLLIRGPGEFLGTAQSGLPRLRVGHLLRDADLIERARMAAIEILHDDPGLESNENRPLLSLLDKKPGHVHL